MSIRVGDYARALRGCTTLGNQHKPARDLCKTGDTLMVVALNPERPDKITVCLTSSYTTNNFIMRKSWLDFDTDQPDRTETGLTCGACGAVTEEFYAIHRNNVLHCPRCMAVLDQTVLA